MIAPPRLPTYFQNINLVGLRPFKFPLVMIWFPAPNVCMFANPVTSVEYAKINQKYTVVDR